MAIGALSEIVVDCPNPEALARFWQALLGGEVEVESDDWAVLDGDEEGFFFGFQRVAGKKTTENRVRVHVEVDDLDAAVDEVEQLGARKVGARVDEDESSFQVMLDLGGNEFCLIEP